MTLSTANLETGEGKVKLAREELLAAVQRLNDLELSGGAALVGFTAPGANAVTRTAQEKLREVVSVADYGTGNDTAAFQGAIDALSAEGGDVLVPDADYSGVVAGDLDAGGKVVTWRGKGASLPSDLPGAAISTGNKAIPGSSRGGTKPSDLFYHVDLGSGYTTSLENQTPNVFYVTADVPDHTDHAGQSFLSAYAFHLTTRETTANMGEVRGMKGWVIGDGGNATLRAVHVIAEGKNGYVGRLTGIMGTVDHTDQVDGVWNNVGSSVAVRGQVGAGTMACFSAEAFETRQKPSYGFLVQRVGDGGIDPEVACYEAHGAGNGDMYRGVRDATNGDIVYSVDRLARVMARSYYSGRVTVADDAKQTITVSSGSGSSGVLIVFALDQDSVWGQAFFRLNSTPLMQQFAKGSLLDFTTGPLTGTTGTDGRTTVSAKNDGTIDIENRSGASKTIAWMLIHPSSALGSLT